LLLRSPAEWFSTALDHGRESHELVFEGLVTEIMTALLHERVEYEELATLRDNDGVEVVRHAAPMSDMFRGGIP
jgi:hypothetical protein